METAEKSLVLLSQIANGGSTLILLIACVALGYLIYKMIKERDTIREGYQAALAERDRQLDEVKTEYADSLKNVVKEYVEELKLLRAELAQSKLINEQAQRLITRLEDQLSKQ